MPANDPVQEPGEDAGHTTRRSDLKQGRRRPGGAPGGAPTPGGPAATAASSTPAPSSSPLTPPPYAGRPGSAGASATRPRRLPALPTISVTRPRLPKVLAGVGGRAGGAVAGRTEGLRAVTEPLWAPVVAFLSWISPLGWGVLVLGLVGWGVGAVLDWDEWVMIGAAALGLLALCVLLAIGRTQVRIDTEVEPRRVTVGEPATGRVSVTNESKRRMLPLMVELPVGVSAARFTLPALGSGTVHEELFVVPTERRGVIPVGPASTVQGDPLGLVRRTVRWTDITELFVHPRTISLESLGAGLLRDLEGETTQDMSMSDLAFHALREYQPGDDRRYIHWRSSAKAGRLLVRQFLDTRRSHLTIVLDTSPTSYADGEPDVETAISVAASLAKRAAMDEQDFTVVCRDARASRTTASLALDELARTEPGASDVYRLAGDAFGLAPDTSIAFLVTGSRKPFIEVQRALGQFENEVFKVVLTVDAHERVGVKNLSGLTLMNVTALTDLRAVLMGGVAA